MGGDLHRSEPTLGGVGLDLGEAGHLPGLLLGCRAQRIVRFPSGPTMRPLS